MLIRLNNRLIENFRLYLCNPNSVINKSLSSFRLYYYSDGNMSKGCTVFHNLDNFLDYLRDNGISITDNQLDILLSCSKYYYCSVYPNTSILLLSEKYMDLRRILDSYDNTLCSSLMVINK
jgi:hypothetical protein